MPSGGAAAGGSLFRRWRGNCGGSGAAAGGGDATFDMPSRIMVVRGEEGRGASPNFQPRIDPKNGYSTLTTARGGTLDASQLPPH